MLRPIANCASGCRRCTTLPNTRYNRISARRRAAYLPCAGLECSCSRTYLGLWLDSRPARSWYYRPTEGNHSCESLADSCTLSNQHLKKEESMNRDEQEDTTIYKVVINHEEQYSIWPADRENPPGWKDAGKRGLKPECLRYVEEVWTDMRPLSLRQRMATAEGDDPRDPNVA